MALIELVDFNEIYSANKSAQTTTDTKKRTRRATSKKKQTEETQDAVESTETPTENAEA